MLQRKPWVLYGDVLCFQRHISVPQGGVCEKWGGAEGANGGPRLFLEVLVCSGEKLQCSKEMPGCPGTCVGAPGTCLGDAVSALLLQIDAWIFSESAWVPLGDACVICELLGCPK